MKKHVIVVAVIVAVLCMAACGDAQQDLQADTTQQVATNEAEPEQEEVQQAIAEEETDTVDNSSVGSVTDIYNYEEGIPEITDVSETEKQIYFYRDGLKIFGKLYLPEGEGPFPVLVMQPGFRGSQSICGSMKEQFLENKIACITFDCIGATNPSKSDGTILDMTFLTEVADMNVVLDCISQLPNLDKDNVFVYGHSVGGLVATYTATHRSDVRGIIAAEPSYQMQDEFNDFFPNDNEIPDSFQEPLYGGKQMVIDAKAMNPYENMEEYGNSVIIFAGGKAPSIGAEAKEYLDKAVELFPNAELVCIEEADHSFSGEASAKVIEASVDFIKSNTK